MVKDSDAPSLWDALEAAPELEQGGNILRPAPHGDSTLTLAEASALAIEIDATPGWQVTYLCPTVRSSGHWIVSIRRDDGRNGSYYYEIHSADDWRRYQALQTHWEQRMGGTTG